MSTLTPLLASYLLQAAGAALGAAIIGRLARARAHRFLRHWSRSWQLRCAALLATAAAAAIAHTAVSTGIGTVTSDPRAALAAEAICGSLAVVLRWLEVATLLLAAAELIAEGSMTTDRRRLVLGGGLVIGVSAVVIAVLRLTGVMVSSTYAVRLEELDLALSVTVPVLIGGVAHLAMAYGISQRPREPDDFGRGMVALCLTLTAALRPAVLWLQRSAQTVPALEDAALGATLAGAVATLVLALACAVWLLEGEQHGGRAVAEELERVTNFDTLTALPNRSRLLATLRRHVDDARRRGGRVALFALDVDRLKVINDSLGFDAGDGVLKAVADRLRRALRDGDMVGRFPGDEFAVVAPGIHDAADTVIVARKLQEAVRAPVRVGARDLYVTVSIGVSVYPDDGDSIDALLAHAESALHGAKSEGPDLFQLYTAKMNAVAAEQLQLEHALRRAVAADQLELYWQPIVDAEWSDVQVVEAMLRWRHPELGLLRAGHFLGLAEETGLIVGIGDWALEQACRQLREWRGRVPRLRASVNVSLRQLKAGGLAARVESLTHSYALPAAALDIEISERTASECDEAMRDELRALRRLGVRVAIDNFGTGYLPVGVLRAFPADGLKIDTAFVANVLNSPQDGEIAASVIALAHALQLTVTAEGVESPAQLELLRRHGCQLWQGYLCCPPVAAADAGRTLGRKLGARRIAANETG